MGVIVLELGGATLAAICANPQVSYQQKLAYAVDAVDNVAFLHRCGVVWGDIKPENMVLFGDFLSGITTLKMIDFESSAVLAQILNEGGELVDANDRIIAAPGVVTAEFTSRDKVTFGYVAPERAYQLSSGKEIIIANRSQDMWGMGVLLHNIVGNGEPLFAADELDKILLVLGAPHDSEERREAEAKLGRIVRNKLGSNKDVARRVIQDVLKADPRERPTAGEISERQSMKGGMSIRASQLLSTMNVIVSKQDELLECMELGFDRLTADIQGTFQLIVNLQRADVPAVILAAPGMRNEPKGKYGQMKQFVKSMLSKKGWTQFFMIYICCEASLLLPGEIEADDEPLHAGFEVALPGPLLVKIAPVLYFFSKLMLVAHHAGKMKGIPIPEGLPFLSDVQKDSDAMLVRLKEINEGFEKILIASDQIGTVNAVVDDMAAALGGGGGGKSGGRREVQPATMQVFDESYGAIKTVLEDLCTGNDASGEMGWEQFKHSGVVERVYAKSGGGVHWVASKHVAQLVASGKFTADQRSLGGKDRSDSGSDSTSSDCDSSLV